MKLILILTLSITQTLLASDFVKVSCLERKNTMCSDSSVLKIYSRRFERECKKRLGEFRINSQCEKKDYLPGYCGIEGHNFQIYFSAKHFDVIKAKKHCKNQRVGAHSLKWIK